MEIKIEREPKYSILDLTFEEYKVIVDALCNVCGKDHSRRPPGMTDREVKVAYEMGMHFDKKL